MLKSQLIKMLNETDGDYPVCFFSELETSEVPIEISSVMSGAKEEYLPEGVEDNYEQGRVILLGRD